MLPGGFLGACSQLTLGPSQLYQHLPRALRVLQILNSPLHQPVRAVAQPAHQPAMAEEPAAVHAPHAPQPAPATAQLATSALTAAAYTPPSGVKKTFYKRKLPCPPATEFSSAEGRLLFSEALQQGTMTGFFKLIEQYSTQDEPAFCGLASIAMVLNALSIDPKRPWKGSWRWFHEQLLDCCLPLTTVAKEGVVLSQAACLAKCNGANVSLHRSGTFSLEAFRSVLAQTCASGEEHIVVSYSRRAFGQTGDGHFSPVGGYHAGRDLVLILDTARFKYPPHWVPLPMLFDAMAALDPTTGLPRGFLRLSANTRPDSVLFTLDIRPDGSWRPAERFIKTTAPQLVQAAAAAGEALPEALLRRLAAAAPAEAVLSFIAMRYAAQACARDRCVPHTVRQQVLQELRATPLHQMIQPLLTQQMAASLPEQQQQQQGFLSEKLTMLLLLQEPAAWGPPAAWADPAQHRAWQQLLDASSVSIVEGEVQYLRQQLLHIDDVLREGADGAAGEGEGAAAAAAAGAAAASSSGICSSCPFQLDCQVKGCLQGELLGQPGVSGVAAGAAAAAVGGSSGCCGHQPHQDLQQQLREERQQHPLIADDNEAAGVSAALAGHREQAGWREQQQQQLGAGAEDSGQHHACCSHH